MQTVHIAQGIIPRKRGPGLSRYEGAGDKNHSEVPLCAETKEYKLASEIGDSVQPPTAKPKPVGLLAA
jgi:hypothetical protein